MTPDATTLCRHYADVLRASGPSERTIDNYLCSLKGFTRFLGERPLEQATADDIVAYQVDVAARGKSDSCVRVATYALRGFYRHVLLRNDWNEARLPRQRRPKRLPEVLSSEEVEAILEAAPNLKYRTAFMLCYGAGLRTNEVVHLEPRHVDSQRMILRVELGKGNKDRQVVLSPRLLTTLREERGLTYLFVSHNLAVIAHMCARVAVMNTGRIVEQVATSALASGALAHPYALQLLKSSEGYDRQAAAALVSYD